MYLCIEISIRCGRGSDDGGAGGSSVTRYLSPAR